ncbi:hypothetical protein BT69DRAFT_1328589 [Atractiella rhizophila]|nr:hypothetical protein BT69DRAFT_1328589 [Atractiella rhizophila]
MSFRGGRGGGRGGGGKPKAAIYEASMLGGLTIAEVSAFAQREGEKGLYPDMTLPETPETDERERKAYRIGRRMRDNVRFGPYYRDEESIKKAKPTIERYSDRYSRLQTRTSERMNSFSYRGLYNPDFFPKKLVWDPYFEGIRPTGAGIPEKKVRKRKKEDLYKTLDELEKQGEQAEQEGDEEQDQEVEAEETILVEDEDVDEDEEGDYGDNYFDNGEDRDGPNIDDLEGGGDDGGGGDYD